MASSDFQSSPRKAANGREDIDPSIAEKRKAYYDILTIRDDMSQEEKDLQKAIAARKPIRPTVPNGRVEGRRLIKWDLHVTETLLLCLQYECAKAQIELPWDAVAYRLASEKNASAASILQHLAKKRKELLEKGLWVPPQMPRKTLDPSHDVRGLVKTGSDSQEIRYVTWFEDASGMINPEDVKATRDRGAMYVPKEAYPDSHYPTTREELDAALKDDTTRQEEPDRNQATKLSKSPECKDKTPRKYESDSDSEDSDDRTPDVKRQKGAKRIIGKSTPKTPRRGSLDDDAEYVERKGNASFTVKRLTSQKRPIRRQSGVPKTPSGHPTIIEQRHGFVALPPSKVVVLKLSPENLKQLDSKNSEILDHVGAADNVQGISKMDINNLNDAMTVDSESKTDDSDVIMSDEDVSEPIDKAIEDRTASSGSAGVDSQFTGSPVDDAQIKRNNISGSAVARVMTPIQLSSRQDVDVASPLLVDRTPFSIGMRGAEQAANISPATPLPHQTNILGAYNINNPYFIDAMHRYNQYHALQRQQDELFDLTAPIPASSPQDDTFQPFSSSNNGYTTANPSISGSNNGYARTNRPNILPINAQNPNYQHFDNYGQSHSGDPTVHQYVDPKHLTLNFPYRDEHVLRRIRGMGPRQFSELLHHPEQMMKPSNDLPHPPEIFRPTTLVQTTSGFEEVAQDPFMQPDLNEEYKKEMEEFAKHQLGPLQPVPLSPPRFLEEYSDDVFMKSFLEPHMFDDEADAEADDLLKAETSQNAEAFLKAKAIIDTETNLED